MDEYKLIELNHLISDKKLAAIVYVFSHLSIATDSIKIFEYEEMIEIINKRFEHAEKMIRQFNEFQQKVYSDEYPNLYLFLKNNCIIGFYMQIDKSHAVSNADELSNLEERIFNEKLDDLLCI